MAKFKEALAATLKAEGGYSNNPNDRGGETYAGISRVFHPRWDGWELVDAATKAVGLKHLDPTKEERQQVDTLLRGVPAMTTRIETFYKVEFWDPLGLDGEPDQGLANLVFHKAVNIGVKPAKEIYLESIKGLLR